MSDERLSLAPGEAKVGDIVYLCGNGHSPLKVINIVAADLVDLDITALARSNEGLYPAVLRNCHVSQLARTPR